MTAGMQQHSMLARPNHDEAARQRFVRDLRFHLAVKVFPGNRTVFEKRVAPEVERVLGRGPQNRNEVRRFMTQDPYYQLWSAMQRNSQEMMWDSVTDTVERQLPELIQQAKQTRVGGTLRLNPDLEIPKYLTARDIHLQPGGYYTEHAPDDVGVGAVYDCGLPIYAMDSLGPENDDLGLTTLDYYQKRFPDARPNSVVELGCTVGHSLLPWARAFPDAEVHGIDVGAPCVRYAHARAEALGVKAHFSQQNAEGTEFESDSVDVIISHFFMHETSKSALKRIFRECLRILKPGGAMLHLDVEQERGLDPLTSFLMDWEVHNNNEQFMGALRDMDIEALAIEAGFDGSKVELVTQPSHMGREQVVGDGYINFFTWPIHVGIK